MTLSRHVALVFALALCSAPARSDLLPQDAHGERPARWRRVWESVPRRLRPTRDVRVRELSDAEMDRRAREDGKEARREDEDDSSVDGMTLLDGGTEPTILLRRSLADGETIHVFAHELSHLVWDTRLSRRQKRRYESA